MDTRAPADRAERADSMAGRQASKLSTADSEAGLLSSSSDAGRLDRIYNKFSYFILPIFVAAMTLSHLDRTNLSFAALTMNKDLGFGPQVYGIGAALFFPTFCFFQVPANLVMLRVGVRWWLGALLVCWGTVASACAAISSPASFYALRLLLGLFEAGVSPAMWYHLSQLYTPERLTKPFSYMTLGILIANVIGAPLAAGFLSMDGLGGLQGWQWLFLLEGIPSVLLGFVVWAVLPETPYDARWLSEGDKVLLRADMARAAEVSPPREAISRHPGKLLKLVLCNPLIAYMCCAGFLLAMAAYSYIFWLPIIISALLSGRALSDAMAAPKGAGGSGWSLLPVLLTAVPYTVGAITTWAVAISSQRRNELYWHCSVCLLAAGLLFALFPVMAASSVAAGFASLVLTVAGGAAANGPGIAIVADISKGPSQVVGMPLYNSVSILGGFVGPWATGAIVARSGGFRYVAVVMGVAVVVCGLMVLGLKWLAAAYERRQQALGGSRAGLDMESAAPGASGGGGGGEEADGPARRPPSASVLVSPLKDAGTGGGQLRPTSAGAHAAAAEQPRRLVQLH